MIVIYAHGCASPSWLENVGVESGHTWPVEERHRVVFKYVCATTSTDIGTLALRQPEQGDLQFDSPSLQGRGSMLMGLNYYLLVQIRMVQWAEAGRGSVIRER